MTILIEKALKGESSCSKKQLNIYSYLVVQLN